jgi:hypothetical protein
MIMLFNHCPSGVHESSSERKVWLRVPFPLLQEKEGEKDAARINKRRPPSLLRNFSCFPPLFSPPAQRGCRRLPHTSSTRCRSLNDPLALANHSTRPNRRQPSTRLNRPRPFRRAPIRISPFSPSSRREGDQRAVLRAWEGLSSRFMASGPEREEEGSVRRRLRGERW